MGQTPAKTLIDKIYGYDWTGLIPQEFRAQLKYVITKIPGVNNGTEPDTPTGNIVSSSVKAVRINELEKETTTVDLTILFALTITDYDVDPETGVVTRIQKQIVATSSFGDSDAGYHSGSYIEFKGIGIGLAIKITSTVISGSLPSPVTTEMTADYPFPNVLNDAYFAWSEASVSGAHLDYDFAASLITDISTTPGGPYRARMTESYFIGAPPSAVSVTTFAPVAHSFGYAWAFAATSAKASSQSFSLPACLHDTLPLNLSVTNGSGDLINSLGATTPADLPHGSWIVKEAIPQRIRLNLWRLRKIEVMTP